MQIDGTNVHAERLGRHGGVDGWDDGYAIGLGGASSGGRVCMCACVRGGDGVGDVDGRACIV